MGYHRLNLGITKVYLLSCTEGFLLVDTGYHQDYDRFCRELNRVGARLPEIKYLLLTHHHDDHAGFAARLVGETDATVIAHQRSVGLLARGENEQTTYPVTRRVGYAFGLFRLVHPEFKYPPLRLDDRALLVAGDDDGLLRSLGIAGAILHTPGHTSDSISVILEDGSCFAGDAAMNFMLFCGTKYRPIYIESLAQVYSSWRKLRAHGAKTIYPAHGAPFSAERLGPAG